MECSKSFAHMRVGEVSPLAEKKLANKVHNKGPPFEEWLPWGGFPTAPGCYYYEGELNDIRDEFLRHSLVPRQTMIDFLKLRR